MTSCDALDVRSISTIGVHECLLEAAYYKNIEYTLEHCPPNINECWAFWLTIKDNTAYICNARMSISMKGKLLPVVIDTSYPHEWIMKLKDTPTSDAIVHWVIEPCYTGGG